MFHLLPTDLPKRLNAAPGSSTAETYPTLAHAVIWNFRYESRSDAFKIIPISDIHLGNILCNEVLLDQVIETIAREPSTYWIGVGDYIDAITRHDPRYEPEHLAKWLHDPIAQRDIIATQVEKFKEKFAPITGRCLGFATGNHEDALLDHSERDAYRELLKWIKHEAGMEPDRRLGLDRAGWISLRFYRYNPATESPSRRTEFKIKVDHGRGGGGSSGSKASRLQAATYANNADIFIMGDVHTSEKVDNTVEDINDVGMLEYKRRVGFVAGTFMDPRLIPPEFRVNYAARKMLPAKLPELSHVILYPGQENPDFRVRYAAGF